MSRGILLFCRFAYRPSTVRTWSQRFILGPQVRAAFPDVELIVSDNCSTDNTAEVVERALFLAREDTVTRILKTLKNHPELDYVFVNVSTRPSERKNGLVRSSDFPELVPAKCGDLSEHAVEKWQDLIDPHLDDVFLGALMCSVFRLFVWRGYQLDLKPGKHYRTLENTYPR
jgi:hypothetical protein